MNIEKDTYFDLNRRFSAIPVADDKVDPSSHRNFRGNATTASWDDLLEKKRVVILAEAGAGKTEEMRAACRSIRKAGGISFFIRLEHLVAAFDCSFDEGNANEFDAWLQSPDKAWIFLDSVDEARLQGPQDFERAIRMFASKIESAGTRSHIYISARESEWRPIADLKLVRNKLGLPTNEQEANSETEVELQDGHSRTAREIESSNEINSPEFFSICDLSESEITQFAEMSGAKNASVFVEQIARYDAMKFASRPQDLIELIEFWDTNGYVGTRYERVLYYIERRLKERDANRDIVNELTQDEARIGAMQLAAAVTLTKQTRIKVPGATTTGAIDASEVLNEMPSSKHSALLQRPIFDDAIYGMVRFHHRLIREFLTARWALDLMEWDGSRLRVMQLFFKNQYGHEVVVPTMRAILPWVALENDEFLDRTVSISPDLLVDFGDPTRIPLPARIRILKAYCKQKKQFHDRWNIDRAGLVRFSKPDLVPTIRELLKEYSGCADVTDVLLEFILHGELKQLASDVLNIAVDSKADKYTVVWALRALAKVGSESDVKHCVDVLFFNDRQLSSQVLSELVYAFGGQFTLAQLVNALGRLPCVEDVQTPVLVDAICEYLDQCSPEQQLEFISKVGPLVKSEPFVSEACSVSAQFSWLVEPAIKVVEYLLRSKDSLSLNPAVFGLINTACMLNTYGGALRTAKHQLEKLIPQFEEFNRTLFWDSIANVRRDSEKAGERVEYWWRARMANRYWQFDDIDFDYFVEEVNTRSSEDDQLVALSMAFAIYRHNRPNRRWYRLLKKTVKGKAFLESRLHEFFHPKPKSEEEKRLDRKEAYFGQKKKIERSQRGTMAR